MAISDYLKLQQQIKELDSILGISHGSTNQTVPETEQEKTGNSYDNLIEYFPDAFCKTPNSNNDKLLKLISTPLKKVSNVIQSVYDSGDIFKAKGKTLDYYGDMYSVERGNLNDTQYRYMILSAITRNMVGGDYESILEAITIIFNCDKTDVRLSDHVTSPATIKIEKMPFSVIMEAGFSSTQATKLIENLLPITVSLESGEFEGTFEFGENYKDYDENKGFSDSHEEPTMGGYFGLFYGEESLFGTFEFSETDNEYDEFEGFADEEGAIGGELGEYYGIDDVIEL